MASDLAITNTFANDTNADADLVNENFEDVESWVNANAVHRDGSKAFTGLVTGPATDPSFPNHLARKAYVDATAAAAPVAAAAAAAASAQGYVGKGSYTAGNIVLGGVGVVALTSVTVPQVSGRYYKVTAQSDNIAFGTCTYALVELTQVPGGASPTATRRVGQTNMSCTFAHTYLAGSTGNVTWYLEGFCDGSAIFQSGVSGPIEILVEDLGS